MEWFRIKNNEGSVALDRIPEWDYDKFYEELCTRLRDTRYHIANYFAHPVGDKLKFYCLLMDDKSGDVMVSSHSAVVGDNASAKVSLKSIAAVHSQLHPFEREIAELYGVTFVRSPWNKPLRFAHNRAVQSSTINNYPFYTIAGKSVHEVNVGPIHAGIIEPGAFRFMCNGERVLHLEIALGYQHRGVESLIIATRNRLRQATIAESIAGDSVVAHTCAYSAVVEKLSIGFEPSPRLELERALALELERIAMHIADTGALCMDIGYQLGQVASEALRTLVINSTQLWCGNRFAKGLVRPAGSRFPMSGDVSEAILKSIKEVRNRYAELVDDLRGSSSLLVRFEDCGVVGRSQLSTLGAVGVAARAGGFIRDVRATHPWGAWGETVVHEPKMGESGDVMSRLLVRSQEVLQSADYVAELLHKIIMSGEDTPLPCYDAKLQGKSLSFSLVEGWRGEVCHTAITNAKGEMELYKIKDPSVHNWMVLAISVRGEGISDFPICNKSFNLSYCGHDL